MSTPVRFYALNNATAPCSRGLPNGYELKTWRPRQGSVRPNGFALFPFGVWWAFDRFGLFANGDYTLQGVYVGDQLVHRTCVFPPYFRFPFMAAGDLQIGDVWTDASHRGQGLAAHSLAAAVRSSASPRRTLWYLVDDNNHASIRLAESCGFRFVGSGERTSRLGVRALGSFSLTQPVEITSSHNRAA